MKKTIYAGIYVALIYAIVICQFSCAGNRGSEAENAGPKPTGTLIIFNCNGDAVDTVTNVTRFGDWNSGCNYTVNDSLDYYTNRPLKYIYGK